jgi:hypothetical protein
MDTSAACPNPREPETGAARREVAWGLTPTSGGVVDAI